MKPDRPTPAQYSLGVRLSSAIVHAFEAGANAEEVLRTLEHTRKTVERNAALDLIPNQRTAQ